MFKHLTIPFLILIFCSLSAAAMSDAQEAPLEADTWPTSVSATVEDLLDRMSDEEKRTVRQTKEEDLIQFHHGWGTGIRNHYGLWRGNTALIEDACGKGCHPDDASMVIIEAVWRALQPEE